MHSHVANADITTEVLRLLSSLEGDTDDFVLDTTIRHGHGDQKALAREQQKRSRWDISRMTTIKGSR